MLFTSLSFFMFFIIGLIIYYLVPKKFQWIVLLVASGVFYASFSWKFFFFILFTIITVWLSGVLIDKITEKQKLQLEVEGISPEDKKAIKQANKRKKKLILALCIVANVGILFFLKYANFMISNAQGLLGLFGFKTDKIVLNLILPLGISFYSFQSIGYILDVYWGKTKAEKNIAKFALFVSFFPQIIQGPISRHSDLAPQLTAEHKFDYNKLIKGVLLILWGLVKKLLIADYLSTAVNNGFGDVASLNGLQANFTVLFYLIQDLMDFSGCIDIAMGVAECFGIELAPNFERPYFSLTISEYWRRWHMTLGSWFKDYLFYPISISKFSQKLGKFSKKIGKNSYLSKQVPAIFGLSIVWLTTGIWHGASWNYILWGAYYGILVILGIVFKPVFTKIIEKLKINVNHWAYKIFQWIRTIWLICVGRIIFRAESLLDAWILFTKTFDFPFKYHFQSLEMLLPSMYTLTIAGIALAVVLIVDLIKEFKKVSIRNFIINHGYTLQTITICIMIVVIIFFGSYGPGFSAENFIYMQF